MRALLAFAVILGASTAQAYPHFQISSATTTCSQCHHAPAGGGLLTEWGREESGDTISLGGKGGLLHGLAELPAWLAFGGDVRMAGLVNDVGASEGPELKAFPMQADAALRLAYESLAVAVSVGMHRPIRAPGQATPPVEVVSREHYVAWQPSELGPYLRAGRFAVPYGLRLADHTAFVRKYLGYDLLEEPYAVSGGVVREGYEVHGSAFASGFLNSRARESRGGALMGELRLGPTVLGGSARVGGGEGYARGSFGVHGKVWLEPARLLLQGEMNGVREGLTRWQAIGYAGPVLIPVRGLYIGAAYQLLAQDLRTAAASRHAADLWTSFHPWAHFELMLSGRVQPLWAGTRAYHALLQLHYYL